MSLREIVGILLMSRREADRHSTSFTTRQNTARVILEHKHVDTLERLPSWFDSGPGYDAAASSTISSRSKYTDAQTRGYENRDVNSLLRFNTGGGYQGFDR